MGERYKGFWIDPKADELKDGTGWTVEVYLAEDVGPETIDTQFTLKEVFEAREPALSAALVAGKRIIDKGFKSRDVQSVIEKETQLPSTHRHGLGHQADDVPVTIDGQPTKVPGPENPEDRFN